MQCQHQQVCFDDFVGRFMKKNDLAIMILSCDRYEDLWSFFFESFFKYWPDCNFPLYLVSNTKTYSDYRVTTLLTGVDRDWSTTLKNALNLIDHEDVFFIFEDIFLKSRVDNQRFTQAYKWFRDKDASYLRLRPFPRPDFHIDDHYGVLDNKAMYRTSLFFAFWGRKSLISALRPGESPWEFEMLSVARCKDLSGFYVARDACFDFIHGVERGKWIPSTFKYLQQNGLNPDKKSRPQMNKYESFSYKLKMMKAIILRTLTGRQLAYLLSLKSQLLGSNLS
jgi:hypothetical protein